MGAALLVTSALLSVKQFVLGPFSQHANTISENQSQQRIINEEPVFLSDPTVDSDDVLAEIPQEQSASEEACFLDNYDPKPNSYQMARKDSDGVWRFTYPETKLSIAKKKGLKSLKP